MKFFVKVLFDKPITVGSVVKFKQTIPKRVGFGEVFGVRKQGKRVKLEVCILDKRLQYTQRMDMTYKTVVVKLSDCKHVYICKANVKSKNFQVGDIIRYKRLLGLKNKYGIIVGFKHPDELETTSYQEYNGIDILQCVEIEPVGLSRKKYQNNEHIMFECQGKNARVCEIDTWHEKGARIVL